ncbi:protein MIZU-KUSSEI 1-like [Hordeum vulgare]|uniref:Protein MIZU-KUSSEI 1 n=1 Tax=Hordeum vulgare subsp. vulgare TaxID=112509 RepID=A0A8I6WYX0_HORVV|nr:protein MIZU-KUSSEI 1-like [Hordeum vulgare subsp. vulgare]KAE8794777.1 protein MIZU-KUSSEI 1-like [Hordeum vulgare]
MEKKKKNNKTTTGCFAPIFAACVPSVKQQPGGGGADDAATSRLSFSFADQNQPESIIDPAASVVARKDGRQQQQQHCTVIVGTIFGSRSGRVTFCVQRDPAVPPPFLFELSVPMQSLAAEMASGLLRIALECHRSSSSAAGENAAAAAGGSSRPRNVWTASCNGRDAGHAVRRPPTEWERGVLQSMRTMTAGVGALPAAAAQEGIDEEVMYMRATYERVVGSKDAVSYHLISPRTAGDSPPQELSLFLLRTRGD